MEFPTNEDLGAQRQLLGTKMSNASGRRNKIRLLADSGLIGRNGTGNTTFLRSMAIPADCQMLHVEQKVVGDNTAALQCVLLKLIEKAKLLDEEIQILAKQVDVR